MKLLTALAGILISGTGAFCFAYYTSRFSDVAFLVGVVMMVSGVFNMIAYLISGRGEKRTTDTALVEGLVTLLYGFAVISNQVTDSNLTMFFGTWLTLCGVTRFSQSLYVSRFNPKDWSKILPLAIIAMMVGVVMMLPWLLASVMPLMLVGGAMLLDGFSVIVYAMYMKRESKEDRARGEIEAEARFEAKKKAHEEERAEQERLRSLSHAEREKEEAIRRAREMKEEEEHRNRKAAERDARRAALRGQENTLRLSDEEVMEIRGKAASAAPSFDDIDKLREEKLAAAKAERNRSENEGELVVPARRNLEIPSFRQDHVIEKKPELDQVQLNAINLDEIENAVPIVNFEKVELPEVQYASSGESVNRQEVIQDIVGMQVDNGDKPEYETIDLEELVAEPLASASDPADAVRFTQKLDFTWIEKLNQELEKKERF